MSCFAKERLERFQLALYFDYFDYLSFSIALNYLPMMLECLFSFGQSERFHYENTVDTTRIKPSSPSSTNICTALRSCATKYFWKTVIEVHSSHIYASFGNFYVQIGQLFEAQWDFKLSKKFEIDDIFLRSQRFVDFQTYFKDSLCLEKLINLDAKGIKRSVKMWPNKFYKNIFRWVDVR